MNSWVKRKRERKKNASANRSVRICRGNHLRLQKSNNIEFRFENAKYEANNCDTRRGECINQFRINKHTSIHLPWSSKLNTSVIKIQLMLATSFTFLSPPEKSLPTLTLIISLYKIRLMMAENLSFLYSYHRHESLIAKKMSLEIGNYIFCW